MRNLPKVSHAGSLNPYYGMKHTEAIRDSISISNGTPVVAYESMADSANAFLGTYNSATKASQGLRLLGVSISRPTVLSYLRSGRVYD